MREQYFDDLGLDNGEKIFEKFNIDVDAILNHNNDDSNKCEENNNIDHNEGNN